MTTTHSGSRVIGATPQAIYQALLDPAAVAVWRPPQGMSARVLQHEPRVGGAFRMAFIYDQPQGAPGKTQPDADVFHGRFLALAENRRVVEEVEFESEEPAFAGAMTVTTSLRSVAGGTEVTIMCENVPRGISQADHEAGIASTLAGLAAYLESPAG